ncbi:hypothetical protein PlfCFBP13513_09455 [Plantibacter flavus]|uniref:hypothetical protein n=1 Tax=Plantibacter TaxID=190323 RepID=UPI0011366F50|nr:MULTISPECIES: hypothetical protein [Plantibacter]TKJ99577.1 hypothetical protein PlfCFBP13513_09455 [Plantibacter flavus]CAH0180103.1 hypothetical protein SRABI02_01464 [Plantibacter cousiniae]
MPTKHARTNLTHTPQVKHALEVARMHWPDEDRESALLLNLLDAGAKALEAGEQSTTERRRARILDTAGRYTGLYEADYLDQVREGWAE